MKNFTTSFRVKVLLAGTLIALLSVQTSARSLDPNSPADNIEAWVKMHADTSGKVVYRLGSLTAYGQPQDVLSQPMFTMVSITKLAYRKLENGDYQSQYWACGLYAKPHTREFIDEYLNPYTNETIKLKPYCSNISGSTFSAKNGMTSRANFEMDSTVFDRPYILEWDITGDTVSINRPASTRWTEKSSGITKVETSIDSFTAKLSDLSDPAKTSVDAVNQYVLSTEWMSMLKMGDRPGKMLWFSNSTKHFNQADLPSEVVSAFEKRLGDNILDKPLIWDDTASENKAVLQKIMSIWPGDYNNQAQLKTLAEQGKPIWRKDDSGKGGHIEVESHYRIVDIPAIGEHVLYVEELKHGEPNNVFRQRLYTLQDDPNTNTLRVKLWYFNDKEKYVGAWKDLSTLSDVTPDDMFLLKQECDLIVRPKGKKLHMAMQEGACTFGDKLFNYQVLLDETSFWFRDRIDNAKTGEEISSAGEFTYHELDRLN